LNILKPQKTPQNQPLGIKLKCLIYSNPADQKVSLSTLESLK